MKSSVRLTTANGELFAVTLSAPDKFNLDKVACTVEVATKRQIARAMVHDEAGVRGLQELAAKDKRDYRKSEIGFAAFGN